MADYVEIDCTKYKDRCQELADVYQNGLSSEKLQKIGIPPGSARAQELEKTLNDFFVHCCTAMHQGPIPPRPSEAGGLALLLTKPKPGVDFISVVRIILIAAALAAAWKYKECTLIESKPGPDGGKVCLYLCTDLTWHTWIIGPSEICAPIYFAPV